MSAATDTTAAVARVGALCWPLDAAGEALEALVRAARLSDERQGELPRTPAGLDVAELGPWLEASAARVGVEVEPAQSSYKDALELVRGAGPALLRLEQGLLVLLGRRGSKVAVLAPSLRERRLSADDVRAALCAPLERRVAPGVDALLAAADIAPRRRERARAAILGEQLASAPIGDCWLLRPPPSASLWRVARLHGLPRRLAKLGLLHGVQYLLIAAAWWVIGRGALQGHIEGGWLAAWGLLLISTIPFRAASTWLEGTFSLDAAALLKQRLLHGVMRLSPDEIRADGAGRLLGRVIESEAIESLALGGGVLALLAVLELLLAAAVVLLGAGGALELALLVVWAGAAVALSLRFYRQRQRWSTTRVELTNHLVEQMVGHRTRLAQQPRERWHDGEDQAVDRYLALSAEMDRQSVRLAALISRGWLVVGLLGLAPAFVTGAPVAALAVGVGGVLLAQRALQRVTSGLTALTGAAIAWQQVGALYRAAARSELSGDAVATLPQPEDAAAPGRAVVLSARELVYRHEGRGEPTLRGCSLDVARDDRLLLQGPSGGGKSTFAALLVGLRAPSAGLLLAGGLDRQTLGAAAWRRRVVAAPQFHENHVLTGTMAFNLLMGRRWPPTPEDLVEAEQICHELGLGPLLERMPAGMQQMVGETGWQLSHGERSRLYIARALLQRADTVILDESFASLDPRSLAQAMRCVLARAPALLVIAHP